MRERVLKIGFLSAILTGLLVLLAALSVSVAPSVASGYDQSDEVFEIRSSEDLAALAAFNDTEGNRDFDYTGKTVLLLADVTAPARQIFDTFNGTFRGNGFTLSGATRQFCRKVGASGSIRDLTFSDVRVSGVNVLTSGNFGTIEDVTVYGSVTSGALVGLNSGDLHSVRAYLTVTGQNALVGNASGGTVRDCFLYADVTVPSGTTVSPLVGSGATDVTGCSFLGTITADGAENVAFYPFGNVVGTREGVSAIYSIDPGAVTVTETFAVAGGSDPADSYAYNASTDAWTVYDDSSAVSSDPSDLTTAYFHLPAAGYPYQKTLFGTEGDATHPFVLTDRNDVSALLFATGEGFYAELGATIYGATALPVSPVGSLDGTVTGNGYLVARTASDPFVAHASLDATDVTVVADCGGDGYDTGAFTAVTPSVPDGNGTASDPYLVRTEGDLAGLLLDNTKNVAGKVAYVTRDVLLSCETSEDRVLALTPPDVRLTLDGLGHTLYHAYDAVFGAVYGSVKNCRIEVCPHTTAQSGVCVSVQAGGALSGVTVYSASGSVTSAFCQTNHGAITRCSDRLRATAYSIAQTNDGTATLCASDNAAAFSEGMNGVDLCTIRGYRARNGVAEEGAAYDDLAEDGFDMTIFGYAVGGDANALITPLLKEPGGAYRTVWSETNAVNALSAQYLTRTYDEDGYEVGLTEDYILSGTTIAVGDYAFEWTYTDRAGVEREMAEEAGEKLLLNVGTYVVRLMITGDGYIPECASEQTVTVQKATFAAGATLAGFANREIEYTGAAIVDEPDPTNAEALTEAGFTWGYAYALSPSWTSAASVKNVGAYRQTFTATAENYVAIVRTRTITVTRKTLTVQVEDRVVTYGDPRPAFGAGDLTVTGQVGEDENKSFAALAAESAVDVSAYFTCSYTQGSPAGEYEIGYTLTQMGNYALSATGGTLTAEKATYAGYTFEDKTVTYDGAAHKIVVGDLPAGTTVTYDPVSQTAAGEYVMSASLSNVNYTDATIYATLAIEKREIVLTASDATKPFGYEFDESDFSYTHTDPVEGETYAEVTAGVTVTVTVAETGALTAGEYDVDLSVEGTAQNYRFTVVKGTLTVGRTNLYAVVAASVFADARVAYTGEGVGYAFEDGAFEGYDVSIAYALRKRNGDPVEALVNVGTYLVTATVTPQNETAKDYETTTYTKTVTVTLITPVITFSQSEYTFAYDKTDHLGADAIDFTVTDAEKKDVTVHWEKNGAPVTEAVRAGTYVVVAEYVGDGNYADARATATVTVEARAAALTVGETYVYARSIVTPATTFAYEDGFEGELTAADLVFKYYDTYDYEMNYVVDAGTYRVKVTLTNTDYALENDEYTITVAPREVYVNMKDLSVGYGASGAFTSGNDTSMFADGYTLTVREYYVSVTDAYVSVAFRLTREAPEGRYYPVGTYTVTDALLVQPANYRFLLVDSFTVNVTKRTLYVTWYDMGTPIASTQTTGTYAGFDQAERYTYTLSGFPEGESETAATTEISGDFAVIKNVGRYKITLSLGQNTPYEPDRASRTLDVNITKAQLTGIYIGGGEVMQNENLPSLRVTIDGLVGEDVGKEPGALSGYSCAPKSEYNRVTATVGQKYSVTAEFTFDNYEWSKYIVRAGTYTVVEGYPRYTMPSARYTYDGTAKTLSLTDVAEGITVTYRNNSYTDSGTYEAIATVEYPTGRRETLRGTLTIDKATPTVVCEAEYGVYTTQYEITASGLGATATLNDRIPYVAGTYRVTSGSTIRAGRNTVGAVFTPEDTRNLNAKTFTKTVVRYELTALSCLVYGGNKDFIVDEADVIHTMEPIEITLDRTGFPEIAEDVDLYFNGEITNKAVLNRTAKEILDVRYRGRVVFSMELNVAYGEKDVQPSTVTVDERVLVLEGLQYSEDGQTLYLTAEEGVGTIALGAQYADEYVLYVNGEAVEGEYTVRDTDRRITVVLYNKALGVGMFTRASTVSTDDPEDNGNTVIEPEKKVGFKTYYWYIIGGVGGAAVLALVLVIVLRRR